MSANEKEVVESFVGEAIQLVSKIDLSTVAVSVWRNALSLPSVHVCSFVASDGAVVIPNRDETTFRSSLLVVVGSNAGVDRVCDLVKLMSPALRHVVRELRPDLEPLLSNWQPPELTNSTFRAFVENLTTGRVERFRVAEGICTIDDVAAGIRLDLV